MSVLCVNSNMKATTQRELKMHWFSFGPNTPSTVFFVRDDVTSERIEIKYRNPSRIIFFYLLVFAICYSYYIGSSSPSLLVKFPSCHHYCCLNPNLYIPPKTTKKSKKYIPPFSVRCGTHTHKNTHTHISIILPPAEGHFPSPRSASPDPSGATCTRSVHRQPLQSPTRHATAPPRAQRWARQGGPDSGAMGRRAGPTSAHLMQKRWMFATKPTRWG